MTCSHPKFMKSSRFPRKTEILADRCEAQKIQANKKAPETPEPDCRPGYVPTHPQIYRMTPRNSNHRLVIPSP